MLATPSHFAADGSFEGRFDSGVARPIFPVPALRRTIHTFTVFGMDAVHKKTLNLDEARLKRARRILRLSTDTATIHAALDWVIEGDAIVDDMLAVAGRGRGRFRFPKTPRAGRRRSA
jgi:hypothetical protein